MIRLWVLLCCFPLVLRAQPLDSALLQTVQQHLQFLTSDSLNGRGNYTPELHQAAEYISSEFKRWELKVLPGLHNYLQPFTYKEGIAPHLLLPDSSGRYHPEHVLLNVIGVLPGKTLPGEAVIFSAHYDHLGRQGHRSNGIHNGANDNASGTAALLALAQHYARAQTNERTLIFCAFAGEELGLLGSGFFSNYVNASSIKAVINIEMIGRHDFVGKRAFFITGAYHSDLSDILAKNLKGSPVRIRMEPDEAKKLFQRSDNYPFARKGIPAHSIMASDDEEPCYHLGCDDLNRLDLPNMTRIIQGIITGSGSIIQGKDTPRLRGLVE